VAHNRAVQELRQRHAQPEPRVHENAGHDTKSMNVNRITVLDIVSELLIGSDSPIIAPEGKHKTENA
jgi:hypothetical protein